MLLKRYRVQNIQEALQQIKKDLGPDAIIVSTRQVRDGGKAFGLFGKPMLEVTAARDKQASSAAKANTPETEIPLPASTANPYASLSRNPPAPPMNQPTEEDSRAMLLPLHQEIQELKDLISQIKPEPVAQEQRVVGQLRQEISEIRQILQSVAAKSSSTAADEHFEENLKVLFQQMQFGGLEEKFARRIIQEAQKNLSAEELQNFAYVKVFVARMLMKIVKTTKGIQKQTNAQKLVAFIGPTGVGKTTTVAKIASEQALKYHRKVALITIDTFRIGAVEQLRTYAKIMKIPLKVVSNQSELNQAITHFSSYDVVLIDTGGRSQRDELQMFELRELFEETHQIENILVLSATTKDHDLTEITRRFGEMPIDSVIFTKLDESTTYGSLFNHVIRFKRPISFLTTGQKVPEDIEVATKERLVDLLLNFSGK